MREFILQHKSIMFTCKARFFVAISVFSIIIVVLLLTSEIKRNEILKRRNRDLMRIGMLHTDTRTAYQAYRVKECSEKYVARWGK